MGTSFINYFQSIHDPRIDRKKLHLLEDIIGLTLIAVLCGAESWRSIEAFGKIKEKFLKKFLQLSHGIPSHDTIERLFQRIHPEEFERCFIEWTKSICENFATGKTINIDGKTLRGSRNKSAGMRGIHMVSAWAEENRMVLGQVKVDEKTNEITAIPELLRLLDITGSLITIDAMGCQTEIAEQIIGQKGDYLLAVKGNQQKLSEEINGLFHLQQAADQHQTLEKDHGRIEERKCVVIHDLKRLKKKEQWKGAQSIIMVETKRQTDESSHEEIRHYISSKKESAEFFNAAVRQHWSIENSFHWVLDVGFREDHSQKQHRYAARNFAYLRRMALNLHRQDKTVTMGIHYKRLMAGWNEEYLLRILKI